MRLRVAGCSKHKGGKPIHIFVSCIACLRTCDLCSHHGLSSNTPIGSHYCCDPDQFMLLMVGHTSLWPLALTIAGRVCFQHCRVSGRNSDPSCPRSWLTRPRASPEALASLSSSISPAWRRARCNLCNLWYPGAWSCSQLVSGGNP